MDSRSSPMMAHVVRLGALTDELITVITGLSATTDSNRFNINRESALRTLRNHSYARINQFDVQHQLEGLEEKFRVYNEDGLADALRQRLDELAERSTKWTPEILHLLLELSDKPVVKSTLGSLQFLKPPEESAEPCYKWEDLAAEDPLLRDRHVWRSIDYGAESSDDEGASLRSDLEGSSFAETTALSSIHDGDPRRTEDFVVLPDSEGGLTSLKTAQFWRERNGADIVGDGREETPKKPVLITELQAIREILFVLAGLPTSLFVNRSSGKGDSSRTTINPASGFALKHASPQLFHGILTQFAEYTTALTVLRAWTSSKQAVPLLQSLQNEVMVRLRLFDSKLSDLQKKFVAPHEDLVISIAEIQSELISLVRPLLKVSNVILRLKSEPYAHAFRCLELLYDETCTSQMAGNDGLYEFMGTLFFNCFQIYLRPIRKWMEEGELRKDDNAFFVSETTGDVELASLWQNRYKLRKTSSGALHAPNFLHPAAGKIFTTGKSVVVLKKLGKYTRTKTVSFAGEPKLDFQTVCGPPSLFLAPFPELFDVAFEDWIQSKHYATSSTLCRCLFDDCGLLVSLDAMENIYFMADGGTTGVLANAIFEKLDSGKKSWNDRFSLTELARSTIGSLSGVTAERFRASISPSKYVDVQISRKSVKSLSAISFMYSLPWSVQIIIAKDTIPSYHGIFSFLLQIRRSTHILECTRLGDIDGSAEERAAYYGLRSRMLWFNSTLYSYLTDLVIRPNTSQLRAALTTSEDVDQMIEAHGSYIKRLTSQALLGSKLEPIHKTIIAILDLSIQLSDACTMRKSRQVLEDKSVASVRGPSSLTVMPRIRQQRYWQRRDPDSSDEDYDDNVAESSAIITGEVTQSYIDRLRSMRGQLDHLCKFVAQGLRGVARAGGEPNWDMLADKLESGLGATV